MAMKGPGICYRVEIRQLLRDVRTDERSTKAIWPKKHVCNLYWYLSSDLLANDMRVSKIERWYFSYLLYICE